MRLGPSHRNSWDVTRDRVDLVRPTLPPRRCAISAQPQSITIDLNRTAIIVVDMQNDFCAPGGWFHSKGSDIQPMRRPIPRLTTLLPALREEGIRVIWVNWGNRPDLANLPPSVLRAGRPSGQGVGYGDEIPRGRGRVLERGSWGAEVVDELALGPQDIVVHKYRFSGFADNELDSILRNQMITTLLFAGINTDRCVLATLLDASFLGYDCILVEDACSTPSPDYCSEAVMFLMKQLYGFTTRSADILRALEGLSRDPIDRSAGAEQSPSQ